MYCAVKKGLAGKSPPKKGPPPKIPSVLLKAVATHVEVAQVGEGELKGRDIKRLIGASMKGTVFENTFKVETAWKKLRIDFPESLQAATKLSVEDARASWTTHNNLDQWFDDARKDLIKSGLVKELEVRNPDGTLQSELDFRGEDVKRRIINMDETHHNLSITGNKGGPRAVTYHCPHSTREVLCVVSSWQGM